MYRDPSTERWPASVNNFTQGLVSTTKGEGDVHLGPGYRRNEVSVENIITLSKNCTCGISTGLTKACIHCRANKRRKRKRSRSRLPEESTVLLALVWHPKCGEGMPSPSLRSLHRFLLFFFFLRVEEEAEEEPGFEASMAFEIATSSCYLFSSRGVSVRVSIKAMNSGAPSTP